MNAKTTNNKWNWYQVDLWKQNSSLIETLKKVVDVIDRINKISKWFYLFEYGEILRVRLNTRAISDVRVDFVNLAKSQGLYIVKEDDKETKSIYEAKDKDLKEINPVLEFKQLIPFSEYYELSEALSNKFVLNNFANIMSDLTELVIMKLVKDNVKFSNFEIMERISHCMYNIIAYKLLTGREEHEFHLAMAGIPNRIDIDFECKL